MLIEKKQTKELLPADYNPRKDLKPGDPEYEKIHRVGKRSRRFLIKQRRRL